MRKKHLVYSVCVIAGSILTYSLCSYLPKYFGDKQVNSIKFSSGPCAKFQVIEQNYANAITLGRSHRSILGLNRINKLMDSIKQMLEIPDNYKIAIISGSETGAMECLLWNLLGCNSVDILEFGVFSKHWGYDVTEQLKITDVRKVTSDCFTFPYTGAYDSSRDLVFCLTETTTGVAVSDLNWIKTDRSGLTICDATAAVFCQKIDWEKLDAASFSWQKGVGGEAGLGCIVLSPRAIKRLKTYTPQWPIPRIFRLRDNGVLNEGVFEGKTINTPSMLCIEDMINIMTYVEEQGGSEYLFKKISENYEVAKQTVENSTNLKFCVEDENIRAKHIICIDIKTDKYVRLDEKARWDYLKRLCKKLDSENVACDILGHILSKPHLRLWAGPTINSEDIKLAIEKIDEYISINTVNL